MVEIIFDGANSDCFIHRFSVNGIDAEETDFGETEFGSVDGDNYCCNVIFVPSENPEDAVLKKYSITNEEFSNIAEMLGKKLSVGYCGQCI